MHWRFDKPENLFFSSCSNIHFDQEILQNLDGSNNNPLVRLQICERFGERDHRCSCEAGYRLLDDRKTCVGQSLTSIGHSIIGYLYLCLAMI